MRNTRVAVSSCALAVVLSVMAGTRAAEAACSSRGLRSVNSNTPTKITFVNQSGTYRRIEWIDFNGGTKDYGGLNTGESKTIDTFLTHPWMITNGPGDCERIVMPRAGGSVVRLSGGRGPSEPE